MVVNTLSDHLFYASWKCVAKGGSMLNLSQWDSAGHEKSDRGQLGGNLSIYSFDIVTLLLQKPSMAKRLVKHHLPIFPSTCYAFEFPFTDSSWNLLQTSTNCFGSLSGWIDTPNLSCGEISSKRNQRSVPSPFRQPTYWSCLYPVSTRFDHTSGRLC